MPTFVRFHEFLADRNNKVHNLGSDTLKWMLTNTAPDVATDGQKSDITEISAGNGYTAGGVTWSGVTSTQSGGTYYLKGDNVTITAVTGTMATWRYAVLYNDSATNDELIGYVDFGVGISLNGASSESFTIYPSGSLGVFYES